MGTALAEHDAREGTQLHATFFTNERSGIFGRYLALDETKVASAEATTQTLVTSIVADSKKSALRSVAVLPLIMLTAYVLLLLHFRRRGGYRAVALNVN